MSLVDLFEQFLEEPVQSNPESDPSFSAWLIAHGQQPSAFSEDEWEVVAEAFGVELSDLFEGEAEWMPSEPWTAPPDSYWQ